MLTDREWLALQHFFGTGVVLFGKTNVPLMLADAQSYNAIYGTTNNPWDLARTPGGSSGGAGPPGARHVRRTGSCCPRP